MTSLSDLYKLNASGKMIDDLLVTPRIPPFGRVIVLAAGYDDPERGILSGNLLDLRHPGSFLAGKMYIARVRGRLDPKVQDAVKVIAKAPDEVVWGSIAPVNQRVVAIYRRDVGVLLRNERHVRIVVPERRRGC